MKLDNKKMITKKWSEFLATDPEVLGSIPDPTRFSGTGSTQPREDN
jgi:hypothetical protein